jgi:two-component system, OmpR family, response regulator
MAFALHYRKVMRVLLAENDEEFLDLLANTLERLGADVVRACSGREMQDEILAGTPIDLVVTDVSMPDGTGLEVMTSARTAGLACPIVVMTASRDQITAARAAALGDHVALLYKPFSIAELCAAMRDCLADPRLAPASAA